ncbi:MAG: hypothetical protein H8D26_02260 [Methanomicrobia archaeon]|nr:hypothetical protein [Methanomicrobia archaeon]
MILNHCTVLIHNLLVGIVVVVAFELDASGGVCQNRTLSRKGIIDFYSS